MHIFAFNAGRNSWYLMITHKEKCLKMTWRERAGNMSQGTEGKIGPPHERVHHHRTQLAQQSWRLPHHHCSNLIYRRNLLKWLLNSLTAECRFRQELIKQFGSLVSGMYTGENKHANEVIHLYRLRESYLWINRVRRSLFLALESRKKWTAFICAFRIVLPDSISLNNVFIMKF